MDNHTFDAVICEEKEHGGAYVIFPWDIRQEFGAGQAAVSVLLDGIPCDGSIVNMGVKDARGNPCYIIGILNSVQAELGNQDGDPVHVIRRR